MRQCLVPCEMSKLRSLKVFVSQRLTAAVEEIFGHFEKTITEYEEEMNRRHQHRQMLDVAVSPPERQQRDVQQLLVSKEEQQDQDQDQDPSDPPGIKEEPEEVWTSQEGLEEADGTSSTLTPVHVKKEDDNEEKPGSSHRGAVDEEEDNDGDPGPDGESHPHPVLPEPVHPDHNTSDIHNAGNLYRCPECKKSFGSLSYLKLHVRCHTGEKPYRCPVCRKCFLWSGRLKKHLRIHTGEKPFRCSECGKGFGESGNLKVHMRTHTGEKPYTCSACGKRYRHKWSLTKHLEVHRKQK